LTEGLHVPASASSASHASADTSPSPGIDKPGFIDNSSGAPIYNAPAETGGTRVRKTPLSPAARVFVSGTHP